MRRRESSSLKKSYAKQCPSCKHRLPANVHKCGFCGASPWYWQEDRIIWIVAMTTIVVGFIIFNFLTNK